MESYRGSARRGTGSEGPPASRRLTWRRLAATPGRGRHLLFGHQLDFVYDLTDGRQVAVNDRLSVSWMVLSPDATRLASLGADGWFSLYRFEDGRLDLISRRRGHRDNGRSLALSPDGRLVATAAEDIVLWDAATHEKIARLEYAAIVWSVVFSPDGRWLVSSHADGAILIWDVAERQRVFSFSDHSAAVRTVAFSPLKESPFGVYRRKPIR